MAPDDERAFFDPIRDAPADDGPRLIYADWLDEHGQPDRADFVRLQCALDRLADDDPRKTDLRHRARRVAGPRRTAVAADQRQSPPRGPRPPGLGRLPASDRPDRSRPEREWAVRRRPAAPARRPPGPPAGAAAPSEQPARRRGDGGPGR